MTINNKEAHHKTLYEAYQLDHGIKRIAFRMTKTINGLRFAHGREPVAGHPDFALFREDGSQIDNSPICILIRFLTEGT